jgi:hypothetical protein
MQEYIKKIEDENKKLVEELGRKEALISSTPFNSTLYLTFGMDYEFDGTLCGFLARLSYAFTNPYTGTVEDKHIKRYEEKYDSLKHNSNDYRRWTNNLLYKVDTDLRDFFNTGIQSFKTNPNNINSTEGIPWINIAPHELVCISMFNENMVFDLFKNQMVLSMRPFKRITRWTRFKQFMKGI